MLNFKFDPNSTYLAACTYGPDSMSLLDMMQKDGVTPIVCFVNYHKVVQSDQDQKDLAAYCASKGLTLEICDTEKTTAPEYVRAKGEDFKEWARKVRYAFFKAIYQKYNAAALFLAHQQDDLIETYLLEKQQKKGKNVQYGWNEISTVDGLIVVRPLLPFSKEDLLQYAKDNHVPYSVSASDIEARLVRDSIRNKIDAMTEIDRANIINEMHAENSEQDLFMKGLSKTIDLGEELNIRELIALSENEFAETLIKYISKAPVHVNLTSNQIADIRKMALAPQPNMSMRLAKNVYLIKEYDVLTIGTNIDELPFCYTLDQPGKLDTPQFSLDFSQGAEDRGIKAEDYPLTIRTALPGDMYVVHGYLQTVRRLYIDWQMPTAVRCVWPIFLNKDGHIVYIPRFHRLERDSGDSKFVLKIKEECRQVKQLFLFFSFRVYCAIAHSNKTLS
jgi:tRNA(Ile)-lysidine synthetase-like protein